MTVNEWLNNDSLGIDIWEKKYRQNGESLDEWFERVSGGDKELAELIKKKKFLFGGRTLANRGLDSGSLSNCYCSGRVADDLNNIMETAKNIAETFKAQGGQGLSLSDIRPKGAIIGNRFPSDGIVPFMEIFNTITASVSQGGHRRGALMMSLDVEHPQIKDFITIKSDHNKINNANLSVEINDRFMIAVKKFYDTGEIVKYKIKSKYKGYDKEIEICPIEIYKLIMHHVWKDAEPGVMFMEEFSNYNLMEKVPDYKIFTSNPCGEQPLPAMGACNLSSINISAYIKNEFTENAYVDLNELSRDMMIYVRAMDKIVDENSERHALQGQRDFSRKYRNIGIGVMGLADAMIKLGIVYGSKDSIDFANNLMKIIFRSAVQASNYLAKTLGKFPGYDNRIFDSAIIRNAFSPEEVNSMRKYGLRNSSLISIAPTGSIGTLLNVSTGVECWYASSYTRKTVSLSGEGDKYYQVEVPIFAEARKRNFHPEALVVSGDINWHDRVNFQAALQEFVDTAISSTVNLPENTTEDEIAKLYLYAWEKHLKGITAYRAGSRDAVLSTKPNKEEKKAWFNQIKPVSRKSLGTTCGSTSCKKCACGTLYITCNHDSEGNLVEVFTNTSKGGICQANMNAVTRLISLNLRSGVKVDEILDQLKGINCPACSNVKARGVEIDGLSCPDIIQRTIKEVANIKDQVKFAKITEIKPIKKDNVSKCPECGEPLVNQGGCVSCLSCGYSKCGE